MADGDLFFLLTGEDVPSPPDPVPPTMGSCGAELYAACTPIAKDDEPHRWVLAHLCEALGRMRQAVSDLVRDSEDGPGWSLATDVTRAPGADSEIDMLPFLAMLAGVRLAPELDDRERRLAIRQRDGYWRGRAEAIVSFAGRYTVDGSGVSARERYSARLGAGVDAPYHGQVRIRRSRLKPGVDEETLRRRVLARIPAGLIYDVVISDAADFEQVREDFSDFDDLARSFDDFDDLARYEGA